LEANQNTTEKRAASTRRIGPSSLARWGTSGQDSGHSTNCNNDLRPANVHDGLEIEQISYKKILSTL
jgi:hypothetical protein